ncbi:MAG: GNAT family N-acetyltransferase [Cypionkella sp.]|uniref:GNAT family N-acetyltransferase n=1 Tax=Cypionkella sp. TaxID=2811411 RepID=UPI002ABA1B3F|nr:GNAT family N-acetyltransferase [Cypionkella sp.]MDZ4310301.1 GNAT family N-acetyltransferase [Cypionkella sp.]
MIEYRLAVVEDAALIHAMLSEMADAEGGVIGGGVEALVRHGFGAEPRFRVVLVEERGIALGFCLFLPEYSSWRGAMGLFVQDIYLNHAARGKGLGRGLLAAALAHAQDWQPAFMALMVKRSNILAIGFYGTLGFALRDASDPYILEGEGLNALMQP